ncbi:TPA: hypothetical protein H1005_02395 [archaeon]|uniref:Uncharacterized protein n=1 Tax=Candidatus Naiadarchaeum limnaeum TaxID=2756139 RepID=A0A832XGT6_9ARCH|nr:hypothetical protein [Candidatus Naiadarchaeales archaeon SRR2090153.bin1042]HIK00564.1 hypothetical protein [Candidatus Naiadarchaeum limnaeum]
MKVKRSNIRKLVNELDKNGTQLMLGVLRAMDSENIYYTSILAKNLRHTWANTYKAVNRLIGLGLVKTSEYLGAYRARYDNVRGLVLTTKGYVVKTRILKKKEQK